MIYRFYKKFFNPAKIGQILLDESKKPVWDIREMVTEWCFYVETKKALNKREMEALEYILGKNFEPHNFSLESFISEFPTVLEAGPRLNFETAYSTRAVAICNSCTLEKITRLEYSVRLGIPVKMEPEEEEKFLAMFYDRMTQMRYVVPLKSFDSGLLPSPVRTIPLLKEGIKALLAINIELGLGLDAQDIVTCYNLFMSLPVPRDPTDVELFQLAAGTFAEHTRHNLFRGKIFIDNVLMSKSLMDMIKAPWKKSPGNSLIAFNGSVIRGGKIKTLLPLDPETVSSFSPFIQLYHLVVTAETHNYPTGVAPFFGAETGTGGRIRDNVVGAGRGGIAGVGLAGYCVGNLFIPGYVLPWEKKNWIHPANLATSLEILIGASNGASDYGNCIGEPVVGGFCRTYEQDDRGFIKPVMWTAGIGQMSGSHIKKGIPKKGMLVIQLGGPAYKIGIGGSAASSMIQGENAVHLDFHGVQRGNAEMEQCVNRFYQACVELGKKNPIVVMQDFGAGGDCNAITELVDPAGAIINVRAIPLGDRSMSILEIWGNEAQERYGMLILAKNLPRVKKLCRREKVPLAVIGEITGDGRIVLHDEINNSDPVDLPLDKILSGLKKKEFKFQRIVKKNSLLEIPEKLTVREALNLVLRHPAVCSKRFLTRKVDRSVTGRVAQQQCVGANHIPISDYSIMAQSILDCKGVAMSIGEQPIAGLISPEAMVRLAVSEAILNMSGAKITKFEDISFLANWMLAAKVPGEGAWLYDAVKSLEEILLELVIAIVGGKDSLSMAAIVKKLDGITDEVIKSPGQLVITATAPMKNIKKKVTADFKKPGNALLWIDLGRDKNRLGGSILAQVLEQVGNECPDVNDIKLLKKTFKGIQKLIGDGLISSVHDISDGGRIVTPLEMAFAGNVGLDISFSRDASAIETLFSQEPGLIIESSDPLRVIEYLQAQEISVQVLGKVTEYGGRIKVRHNGKVVLDEEMTTLRHIWEATSTALEMLQANPDCVKEEAAINKNLITAPPYKLTFKPRKTPAHWLKAKNKPKVAILREEGSNGDREAAVSAWLAGFEPIDVNMEDLISGRAKLKDFRGIIFVGGFSFGDVLGAARGWAAVIKFNPVLKAQFDEFYDRPDTFSLGICNGCQLMALLGWVPWRGISEDKQPRFVNNRSRRFESIFSTVKILDSHAIMFDGMAGSVFGIWNSHGEGLLEFPDPEYLSLIEDLGLAPLRFVNEKGEITGQYPYNCNGSPHGITAICSKDGRHLAMMGHAVDRTFMLWQWPWIPEDWKNLPVSPWMRMMQNAYEWCKKTGGKKKIIK